MKRLYRGFPTIFNNYLRSSEDLHLKRNTLCSITWKLGGHYTQNGGQLVWTRRDSLVSVETFGRARGRVLQTSLENERIIDVNERAHVIGTHEGRGGL